jgi:hypothetical protein
MMRKTLAGIAQIMRWGFIDTDSGGILSDNQVERCPWECIEDAHLLIERMVVDGWRITIINWPPIAGQKPFKKFTFYAEKFTDERSFVDFKSEDNDFPAAVVELFCKVYSLDGSADHSGEMVHKED